MPGAYGFPSGQAPRREPRATLVQDSLLAPEPKLTEAQNSSGGLTMGPILGVPFPFELMEQYSGRVQQLSEIELILQSVMN